MSLSPLLAILESAPEFRRLRAALLGQRAHLRLQVISDGAPYALAALWRTANAPVLVIAPRPEDARRLYDQAGIWSGDDDGVLHFPESETLPFERLVTDMDTAQQRLRVLGRLLAPSSSPLIFTSAAGVMQKTVSKSTFLSGRHTLRRGQEVDLHELLDLWRRLGYRFGAAVDVPGTVSRRGGIVDVYPTSAELPARIELWGDEIDSIRLFDPATQRSSEMVDSIEIGPALETLPGMTHPDHVDHLLRNIDVSNCSDEARERIVEEINQLLDGHDIDDPTFYAGFFNHGSILDYFPNDGVVVLLRPSDIGEAAWDVEERAHALRQVKEDRGELPHSFPSSNASWEEVDQQLPSFTRRIEVTPWGAEEFTHEDTVALPIASPPEYFGNTESFVADAEKMAEAGHRVVAVSAVPKRLGEIFDEMKVRASVRPKLEKTPENGSITVVPSMGAGLANGLVLTIGGRKLVVLSDAEVFGVAKQRRTVQRKQRRREMLLSELQPGDHVVHVEHGIGRFMGVGVNERDESGREYLILQYAQSDKLYVPMDHLDRIAPYVAPMDRAPTLTRLGTQEWKRARERVERSTREMAAELLSLYASRELADGHAYPPDTPWQLQMEDSFPYEETDDQVRAIAEVKEDLERTKPMDRLICGDVGYGKTEVALRAAFKAVTDGRQVAILVPTTVLAQQHFNTFSNRLKAFPVKVDVLSRFRSNQEQNDIIERAREGKVDIVIGTHRLIQKDVQFKDLGLVIIDEEQRFGVGHKERLKQMRSEVDVLTLTATPIPRTLHLSLAGIRDMSMIQTPPEERIPIKTYVSEFSDELIREAIRRDLDRQGQVYFLHNRVYNIDYMAGYINKLVPEATVGVAHGQMSEDQLERAMLDFADGKMDVLVCTTIIESGLDIPNVNTLIVNRADTFGLAQLYQLRGRVGRSARRAYAYLLIPPSKSITETAEKRLKTMMAATELGAGFQIAMKDLEIRGAGNILGANQSGHIYAVGFDLYTRMLADAVESLRAQRASRPANGVGPDGEKLEESAPSETTVPPAVVDIGIPANLPPEYVTDLPMRLGLYRRLVNAGKLEEIAEIEKELADRFGPLPWQVHNLLFVTRLKINATRAGISSISREENKLVLRLHSDIGGARQPLRRLLGPSVDVGNTQVRMDMGALTEGWEGPLAEVVEKMAGFAEKLHAELAGVGR